MPSKEGPVASGPRTVSVDTRPLGRVGGRLPSSAPIKTGALHAGRRRLAWRMVEPAVVARRRQTELQC